MKSSFPSESLHQMARLAENESVRRVFEAKNLDSLAGLCGAAPWAVERAGRLIVHVFDIPPSRELAKKIAECADPAQAANMTGLNAHSIKDWHALLMARAALFDLEGEGDPWAALDGYSAAAECAIRFALRRAVGDTERARAPAVKDNGESCEFCVLGMGKLGGRELNASSDVDLVYLYETDEGAAQSGMSLREWFIELSQRLTALLGPDGAGLRVDLRLRPGGRASAVACSLASAEYHYEYFGQAWERQMLIRTRCVAGSEKLADDFTETLRPFVYRRRMDPKALAEIRRIKSRLDAEVCVAAGGDENVKLSRGGIRELEYVVQTYQLLYGGQFPELRTPSMKDALECLRRRELMPRRDLDTLRDAYFFLRRLENRIQLFDGRQNHRLPPEGPVRDALAKSMGFDSVAELMLNYGGFRSKATEIFDELFAVGAQAQQGACDDAGPPASKGRIHLVPSLKTLSISQLAASGISSPDEAYAIFARIASSPDTRPIKGFTDALEPLIPRIAQLAEVAPEPLAALRAFERFVSTHKASATLLSMLSSDDRMAEVLMRLLGRGSYLAEKLLAHPEAFVPIFTAQDVSEGPLAVEQAVIDAYRGVSGEKALRILRRQKTILELQIALEESYREDKPELAWSLTGGLAAGCIRAVKQIVEEQTEAGLGDFGICLMGSAGEGEPVMNSDLDLVFLRRESADQILAAAAARKIVKALESKSADGALFRVDMRLRPFGDQGILVPTLESAQEFYRKRAPVTTRLALLHCRAVCGNTALDFVANFDKILFEPGLNEAEKMELRNIRKKVRAQLRDGELDVKASPGTLTDIEFFVGELQLTHGGNHKELRRTRRREAIEALVGAGIISSGHARILAEALRWFKSLESRLRTLFPRPLSKIPAAEHDLVMLAKMMKCASADDLIQSFNEYRANVLSVVGE